VIKSFDGKTPVIAPSALVHESACIIGDVEIGENSNIWTGAVLRGDMASIKIGNGTSIQDNSILHCVEELTIGDDVIIGHGAVVHGRKIGNNVIIGNNATVLDGVEIGDYCIIAAGSTAAPNTKIPDRSLVMGVPGKRKSEISAEQLVELREAASMYSDLTRKYKQQGF
jgi:carbonic anhydrase/acetyltransferase-like protein (isoleucine patch superfamily)